MEQICTKCGLLKECSPNPPSKGPGYNAQCKDCVADAQKIRNDRFYALNRDRVISNCTEYAKSNEEKTMAYQAVYRSDNKEELRKYFKEYAQENSETKVANAKKWWEENRERALESRRILRQSNPSYAIRLNLSSRLSTLLSKIDTIKSDSMIVIIGCDVPCLKIHLESKFRDGMSWENYGSHWEVDHIKPCSSFDLSNPSQQMICFKWDNLQPLTVVENRKKGASYDAP